jgi:hypothetical protein
MTDELTPGAVPEIWTQQGFDFPADYATEFGMGIPQEMVPAIASAVLDTLAHLDIDPGTVYLSGHDGLEPNPDYAKTHPDDDLHEYRELALTEDEVDPAQTGLDYTTQHDYEDDDPASYDSEVLDPRQASPLYEFGEHQHDQDEAEHAENAEYDERGRRHASADAFLRYVGGPEKPVYYMSDVMALHHDAGQGTNPIHYAGATSTSTIVVYDKPLIDGFGGEEVAPGSNHVATVSANEAELAVAVLARIRLRYRIPGEPDLAPPPIPDN